MIQLKTDQTYKFGQTNTIPVAGEVKISEEGVIEVETIEQAQQIEACRIGFYILEEVEDINLDADKDIKPKVDENELNLNKGENINPKADENELGEKTLTGDDEEKAKAELIASIDTMTLAQLKDMAKLFPFVEWGTLNKAPLIAYLKSKI